jgi:hypothetical protein
MMNIERDETANMHVDLDMQRIGLGILHAKGDVNVLVSPRNL